MRRRGNAEVRRGTGTPGKGFSKGEVNQVVSHRNELRSHYERQKQNAARREEIKNKGTAYSGPGREMRGGPAPITDRISSIGNRRNPDDKGRPAPRSMTQAERVAQIAKKRGVSTEQASELFKQRKEKRQEARKGQQVERRIERVAEQEGVTKEKAQKLIADRAARRQERRTARADRVANGTAGNGVSRQERIASNKKELLSRIREKMGIDEGKRAEFQKRIGNRG